MHHTPPPPPHQNDSSNSVVITSPNATLHFGVDESYSLSISDAGALLTADTVWGALRGLETASQLARHTWTTSAAGAINASYNELCEALVIDAPRFPIRGLMIDTSRHFMPVSVIKQVMDLMVSAICLWNTRVRAVTPTGHRWGCAKSFSWRPRTDDPKRRGVGAR
jgi:hypothetical protein